MEEFQLIDQRELSKLTNDQWIELLIHTNLEFCPFATFTKVMKIREINYGVALHIQDVVGLSHLNSNQLEYALNLADKALYLKFRNKQITYD